MAKQTKKVEKNQVVEEVATEKIQQQESTTQEEKVVAEVNINPDTEETKTQERGDSTENTQSNTDNVEEVKVVKIVQKTPSGYKVLLEGGERVRVRKSEIDRERMVIYVNKA